MANFSAEVDDWVRSSEKLLEGVFKESSQRVIADMQKVKAEGGRMPVNTGFLRSSLTPSINTMNTYLKSRSDSFENPMNDVTLSIARLKIGDTLFAVYSAEYAHHVEHGGGGRAPAGFVAGATAKWQRTVASVVKDLKRRMLK